MIGQSKGGGVKMFFMWGFRLVHREFLKEGSQPATLAPSHMVLQLQKRVMGS
jgi:hypothetical protein